MLVLNKSPTAAVANVFSVNNRILYEKDPRKYCSPIIRSLTSVMQVFGESVICERITFTFRVLRFPRTAISKEKLQIDTDKEKLQGSCPTFFYMCL